MKEHLRQYFLMQIILQKQRLIYFQLTCKDWLHKLLL
jgi:hypothetical protein